MPISLHKQASAHELAPTTISQALIPRTAHLSDGKAGNPIASLSVRIAVFNCSIFSAGSKFSFFLPNLMAIWWIPSAPATVNLYTLGVSGAMSVSDLSEKF
jgi:hypothetical protein